MDKELIIPTPRNFATALSRNNPQGQPLTPAVRMSYMDRDAAIFTYKALQNISALSSLTDRLSEISPNGEQYYRQILGDYVTTVRKKYGGL